MDRLEYEGLKPFCSNELQRERLDAYFANDSYQVTAEQLGSSNSAIKQTINGLRMKAAKKGWSPEDDAAGLAPPGFSVKGKSILRGEDGRVKLTWTKTAKDAAQNHEALLLELEEASERIKGLALPSDCREKCTDADLLAVYPYGDPHIGMYAWAGDAQDDFDLKSAVDLMTSATQSLVDSAPAAETGLVVFLGDFYHADNQSNQTARSGNQLDVDSRWLKVFKVGVNTAISLIHLALQKHPQVHVIVEIGNHDDHSALALAVCLELFFQNEPRVTVDQSGQRHHYFRFGRNLIGIHHGDLTKPPNLPGVMAVDRPQDWGETTHRVWYTGHIHTQTRYEFAGCEVESFRILPPRDAWSQSMGYRGARSMDCIVRHKERGEIARHTVHAADLP